ncbi:creatinine amidohydrolase [Bosea lupini]|uniref:Creatinine amidohydrolase n=1 Tax=Bosea lupini TaxID=1036779 RepID=A0A1H7QYF9_9HYPH|nr:creatininase family protein [Bosea lupini]SEL53061.1 creatinine amidohydrolase [Bosea lupini]
MASVLWQELTAEELREKAARDAVVVLPVASMEQHGPHLPVGVDTILCGGVCKLAAERAGDVEVVVAPTLWCGMAEHHMAFGGTFTFDIPTYRAVLLALLKSLERHGFHRVVIVNGHGGNIAALGAFLPDFARETSLSIRATTYFLLAQEAMAPVMDDQVSVLHACEVETSMMMVLAPETVRQERLPDAYGMLDADLTALTRPTVGQYKPFREMTDTGVIGDARRATAAKGQAFLDASADALAKLLSDRGGHG